MSLPRDRESVETEGCKLISFLAVRRYDYLLGFLCHYFFVRSLCWKKKHCLSLRLSICDIGNLTVAVASCVQKTLLSLFFLRTFLYICSVRITAFSRISTFSLFPALASSGCVIEQHLLYSFQWNASFLSFFLHTYTHTTLSLSLSC